MREKSIVAQMILLTEAKSNHESTAASPTAKRPSVSRALNTWHTAAG